MNASIPSLSVTELHKDDIILITVPADIDMATAEALKATMQAKFEGYSIRVAVLTNDAKLSVIRQPKS
jgi:anti-anti-sigma regulatory factor